MIPTTNNILTTDLKLVNMPSKQHRMDLDEKRILGVCDGLEAVRQSAFKILNTERFAYPMYSWNYGIELVDLYGKSPEYACPEIMRRVNEALLQDDRITGATDFEFDTSRRGVITVKFVINTFFGDVNEELVVNV